MTISKNAKKIISLLENAGYEAYAVGGCVRDFLMGRPCDDIDITTSAKPNEVEQVLDENNIRFVETGLKHGTVTAVIDGEGYEVTTYRTDGDYKDSRHPESVEFVSDIKADLSRRDFTVNAMAYNDSDGLVDLFGGKADLDNKIIRAVGDPNQRFQEDALRIMRAIRFASVLGFDIEENTKKAIFDNSELLLNVSAERLFTELSKLLLGDGVFKILMEYKEVLAVIMPEISPTFNCAQNNPWHIYGVWEHTCKSVEVCPKDLNLRLTMLFHDLGKPSMKTTDEQGINHFKGHQQVSADITAGILKRFKVSNEIYDYLMTLIPIHDISISTERKNIKKWLCKLGQDCHGNYYLNALIQVKRADKLAQNKEKTLPELEKLDVISTEIISVIAENEALSVSDLEINGFDLIQLGFKGREIGDTLKLLLENVIDENITNDKASLLEFAEKLLN